MVLKKFQEAISKYKFMEMNMLQRKKILEEKIPEIQKTLSTVEFLMEKKDGDDDTPTLETEFELNDTLYARAKIEPSGTVYLWLGVSAQRPAHLCVRQLCLMALVVGKRDVGVYVGGGRGAFEVKAGNCKDVIEQCDRGS